MNAPISRLEWLQLRQSGIGGSDIAAILGLSPWKTPLDIYLSKVEPIDAADDQASEAAYWGTTLETMVAEEYARRTGRKIQRINTTMRHPEHGFMLANIDRAIVTEGSRARVGTDGFLAGADGLLEVKTAGAYSAKDWGHEGDGEAIPVHYACQAHWYLAVTGAAWCDFAVLVGGQKFLTKRVGRDDEVIAGLIEKARDFWALVEARTPPAPSNGADVQTLWPRETDVLVEADDATFAAFTRAVELRAQIDALDTDLHAEVEKMKLAIGSAQGLTVGGKKAVTYKAPAASAKTDWKKAASDIKGWMLENQISDGVDAVRDCIDQNTTTTEAARRFVFCK